MPFISRFMPLLSIGVRITPTILGSKCKVHRWVAPTLGVLKAVEKRQGGKVTNPRNTYAEWNLEAELYAFGKRVNEEFHPDLLMQAFTDRSYVIKEELKQKELDMNIEMKDNANLAEYGEKFMKEYIQLYLETVLPRFPLQGIAGIREHLMSEELLAHISSHLGSKDIILAAEYPVTPSILARNLKAVIGCLLKSSGEEQTAHFVRDFIVAQLQGQDVNDYWHIEDPWGMLVELTKEELEPRLIGEVGRHTLLACYRVGIYVNKKLIATGFGESTTIAKEMAAREALKQIFGTEVHMYPINFQLKGIPKPDSQVRYQISAS